MTMTYDVIVVRKGSGDLMAAKTAAENGLKVLLIERRKNITQIDRIFGQTFSPATQYVGRQNQVSIGPQLLHEMQGAILVKTDNPFRRTVD